MDPGFRRDDSGGEAAPVNHFRHFSAISPMNRSNR